MLRRMNSLLLIVLIYSLFNGNSVIIWSDSIFSYWFFVDTVSMSTLYISIVILLLIRFKLNSRMYTVYFSWLLYLIIFIVLLFSLSIDLLTCLIWFELSSLPLLMILGYSGYIDRRMFAVTLLIIFTLIGSVLFTFTLLIHLISIQYIYSFTVINLYYPGYFIFILLVFLLYSTKVPCFPFFSWLTEAHVEVNSETSIILAGIVLKFGLIGIIRLLSNMLIYTSILLVVIICLIWLTICLVLCGVLNVIDSKRLLGYSSIFHMNIILYCILVIDSLSLSILYLVIIIHGIISSLLFYAVGFNSELYNTRISSFNSAGLYLSSMHSSLTLCICLYSIGFPLSMQFYFEYLLCICYSWFGYMNSLLLLEMYCFLNVIFGILFIYRICSLYSNYILLVFDYSYVDLLVILVCILLVLSPLLAYISSLSYLIDSCSLHEWRLGGW
jgi:NADH-quinone oxidoreductase subunit M